MIRWVTSLLSPSKNMQFCNEQIRTQPLFSPPCTSATYGSARMCRRKNGVAFGNWVTSYSQHCQMWGKTYQCQISNAVGWFIGVRFSKFHDFSMTFDDFSKFHDFPWLFQKILFSRFSRPCGNTNTGVSLTNFMETMCFVIRAAYLSTRLLACDLTC